MVRLLRKSFEIERAEVPAVLASCALIGLAMCGYFTVRSVRETAGTLLGKDRVADLFLWTWVTSLAIVPAYGWVVARLRRAQFLPFVYGGVAVVLAGFGLAMQADPGNIRVMEMFYVFISVINLFVISVFWGFALELFAQEQTKRVFGLIAAGGSIGAFLGPWLTVGLVGTVGNSGILYLGAALFAGAIALQCVLLRIWSPQSGGEAPSERHDVPVGGRPMIDGLKLLFSSPYLLGIALFVILLSAVNTFLYFEQLQVVAIAFKDPVRRTQVFATMDGAVQTATFLLQVGVTGRIATRLGVTALIVSVPLAMIVGFLVLAAIGGFTTLAIVFCARRIGEYAFVRPGREMLFAAINTHNRYRVKHVIDVPVYRGGDALSSQANAMLTTAHWSPASVSVAGAVLSAAWALNAWWLGRRFKRSGGKLPYPIN